MAANNLGSARVSTETTAGRQNPKNSSHVTLDGLNSDTEFANSLKPFFYYYFCSDTFDFSNEIQGLSYKQT